MLLGNKPQVDKVKLLGTIIDSQLSWAEHIDNIVKKMGCGISRVRKCHSYVPTHFVGTHLETGGYIFNFMTPGLLLCTSMVLCI